MRSADFALLSSREHETPSEYMADFEDEDEFPISDDVIREHLEKARLQGLKHEIRKILQVTFVIVQGIPTEIFLTFQKINVNNEHDTEMEMRDFSAAAKFEIPYQVETHYKPLNKEIIQRILDLSLKIVCKNPIKMINCKQYYEKAIETERMVYWASDYSVKYII